MTQPFRVTPLMSAYAYKTYSVAAPVATHRRVATCAEVSCRQHEHGWTTVVDERTELGQRQAHYIRTLSGRQYREERNVGGGTTFAFPANQRCFRQHTVPLEREPLYIVRGGDWRGGIDPMQHDNAENWVDDFATHQDRIATAIQRG